MPGGGKPIKEMTNGELAAVATVTTLLGGFGLASGFLIPQGNSGARWLTWAFAIPFVAGLIEF